MNMHEPTTRRVYDTWAHFYEATFGACVRKRQIRAVEQLQAQPGDRILDLGIGTGLLLNYYPQDVTVVGVDLSEGMLRKAAERRDKLGLDHCHLMIADALHPPFAEGSFDHLMLSHTISVVSDPAGLMRWAVRLVKPGGRIVLLNHFRSENPLMAWFEKVLNPFFIRVGWKSDLALEEVIFDPRLRVDYRFKLRMADLWQIVVLTRLADDAPAARPAVLSAPAPAAPEEAPVGLGAELALEGHR